MLQPEIINVLKILKDSKSFRMLLFSSFLAVRRAGNGKWYHLPLLAFLREWLIPIP